MTCPITVRLGVYALGAADAAESELVESHLDSCHVCRAELARLKPLPDLLARVPARLLQADAAPALRSRPVTVVQIDQVRKTRARKARGPTGSWRKVGGVAAAAVLGAAAGFGLSQPLAGQPAARTPPAGLTLSAANPVTHVRVTVKLTGTSWGTSIRLLASGLPLNQMCRLIVRSRDGGTEVAGVWDAWGTGPVVIPASVGWRPADISSLQVATTSMSLVTVHAARPAARG